MFLAGFFTGISVAAFAICIIAAVIYRKSERSTLVEVPEAPPLIRKAFGKPSAKRTPLVRDDRAAWKKEKDVVN